MVSFRVCVSQIYNKRKNFKSKLHGFHMCFVAKLAKKKCTDPKAVIIELPFHMFVPIYWPR